MKISEHVLVVEQEGQKTQLIDPIRKSSGPMIDSEEIRRRFTKYIPTEEQIGQQQNIRTVAAGLAALMVDICPQGRNLSLAITALEDSVMRASRAIVEPNE